jgi:hypothetical protein
MTEYIMINHGVGSPEKWDIYFKMLSENNHMIGGSALECGISLKESAFSEAISTTITGYIVIQAESLEKAKEVMEKSPIHAAGGTVELFTLVKS